MTPVISSIKENSGRQTLNLLFSALLNAVQLAISGIQMSDFGGHAIAIRAKWIKLIYLFMVSVVDIIFCFGNKSQKNHIQYI